MDKTTLTAQDLTKHGTYPRLVYISKQPGIISPDIPTEGRNKLYSLPMGFKWAFFSYFDGRYSTPVANAIADASIMCIPWMIESFSNELGKPRLWFIEMDGEVLFTGVSYSDDFEPQPEEQENLVRFSLFDARYWPGVEVGVWARPNNWTMQGSTKSGGGAGMPITKVVAKPEAFVRRATTLAKSVCMYCVQDLYEMIAVTYDLHPYQIDADQFAAFKPTTDIFDAEGLVLRLK